MKSTIIHFEVQADNIERAKEFYEKAFGWKINQVMKKEDGGMMDYWMIMTNKDKDGIDGGMYKRPEKEDEKYYLYDCTIAVENLDQAMEAVKNSGGEITRDKEQIPDVGWFAQARDTEGNRFGLMQPTQWKPQQ